MDSQTYLTLFVPFFEWILMAIPDLGLLMFIGWCFWKIMSWWISTFLKIDMRFTGIESKLETFEPKFDELTVRQLQHEILLIKLDAKVDRLSDRMDEKFNGINERFNGVDERFKHLEEVNLKILSIVQGNQQYSPLPLRKT